MAERGRGFTTRAMRTEVDLGEARPASVPIYQTSTYSFEDPQALAELIRRGKDAGFVYSRWHNPTRDALEKVAADLEGGERAVSFSSGMASISTTLLALARAGDHVVSSPALYGGSFSLMTKLLPRWGIETTLADSHRVGDLVDAMRANTRACYTETIGNPRMQVADLEALSAACRERNIALVVDNTFASPYLCNPLAHGANVVVHSSTKYIGGHHDLTGGLSIGDHETLGEVRELSIDLGGIAGPFDAWLALRGVQTLALRMDRHCATARALARFLEDHDKVSAVWYPGLESHPDHEIARRMLRDFSGMLSFELAGGLEAGQRFQEALEVALVAPSLGGVHTLAVHPPTVTHTQMTSEERVAQGITDGLVRVSVGIEDSEDVLEDFERALEKA
ncbi:MAG TPA: aminotransferase class I/II-fold pyridoxal phosphate-dependent enzyme [Actinomycetota bacterium]|nr:aminotransferase class I/II-fold pyridoxal phosphate-dependent enzyme [Actinomycetota bacterium]